MSEPHDNGSKVSGRPFPWHCPRCRKKEVRPATVHYRAEGLYEGRPVTAELQGLVVPQCGNCGEMIFNYAADEQIREAIRAAALAEAAASED